MDEKYKRPKFVVEGLDYKTSLPIAISVEDGCISDIRASDASGLSRFIGPGLVDLQVNGFAGRDLNAIPLQVDDVYELTRNLWRVGVTSYLPTIITNSDNAIHGAMAVISQSVRQKPELNGSIPGIHLEGPFICPFDGPRGAHDKRYVKAPDWDLFQSWQTSADGLIKLITLSPEWDGASEFIKRCVGAGVKVAIGHTAATPQQIAEAVQAGAVLSTHLGNGAHPILPRHPNYIWTQLAEDELWASFIGDGFHLPPAVIKVILKMKEDKAFLVSDTVSLAGMPPGNYHAPIGGEVVLSAEGRLSLAHHPEMLAGAVKPLVGAIDFLVNEGLCDLRQAWELASSRPASFLNTDDTHGLTVGAPANFVVFSRANSMTHIDSVFSQGRLVYDNA